MLHQQNIRVHCDVVFARHGVYSISGSRVGSFEVVHVGDYTGRQIGIGRLWIVFGGDALVTGADWSVLQVTVL